MPYRFFTKVAPSTSRSERNYKWVSPSKDTRMEHEWWPGYLRRARTELLSFIAVGITETWSQEKVSSNAMYARLLVSGMQS